MADKQTIQSTYEHINQPPFWLEVQKEYIVQNFTKMLRYLSEYHYMQDEANPDFEATFLCLKTLVNDILEEINKSTLTDIIHPEKYQEIFIVKVIATYLLTCQKKDINDIEVLSQLADRLLLTHQHLNEELTESIMKLQMNCLMYTNVAEYGFEWIDIIRENFSIELFLPKLTKTIFSEPIESPMIFENKGVAVLEQGKIQLATCSYADYKKNALDGTFINDYLSLKLLGKKLRTYSDICDNATYLMNLQEQIQPLSAQPLKEYDLENNESEILVEIKSIIGTCIHASTIDPHYEKLKGNIEIDPNILGLGSTILNTYFKKGDILSVNVRKHVNKIRFSFFQSLDSWYKEYYKFCCEEGTVMAIPYNTSPTDKRWITSDGFVVYLVNDESQEEDESLKEDIKERRTLCLPIKVKPSSIIESNENNKVSTIRVSFAEMVEDIEEDQVLTLGAEIKKNGLEHFFENIFEDIKPENVALNDSEIRKPYKMLIPLCHLYYFYSIYNASDTKERLLYLLVARMIAHLCGASHDTAFINYEMKYVRQLVNFASGKSPDELNYQVNEEFYNIPQVKLWQDTILELKKYKENLPTNINCRNSNAPMISKLQDLIHASNNLLDKINEVEIDRIRKHIVSTLGVEDMFKATTRQHTYYGEESDTLEFKTSIVFPPTKSGKGMKPIPNSEVQIYQILKTICGFLNSMSGGELLLGVKDSGFARGLNDDLNYLYQTQRIAELSLDKMILYIKSIVDTSFTDQNKITTNPKDITTSRVNYKIDTDSDGIQIIRIMVRPYEYGVIYFLDETKLPEGISKSYLRCSNTTASMTSEMRDEIIKNKLEMNQGDTVKKVITLQQAKNNHKVVKLVQYQSESGIKDREIEPYHLCLERNAIIGFDIVNKKLREFKLPRFKEVIVTEKKFRNYKDKYKNLSIDVFDMMKSDSESIHIRWKMKNLACNLLKEEHIGAEQFIKRNEDTDYREYPWVFETEIFNVLGAGRFYIGLANHIKIEEGEELKNYITEYIRNLTQQTN